MRARVFALTLLLVVGACCARAAEPSVSLTVYNSDLALVKDIRRMSIEEGVQEIQFPAVAQRIDPTTVHFKVLEGPEAAVWEQNYRFDLASPSKILEKYLEKEIEAVGEDADLFAGKLVSFDGGSLVLDQGRGRGPVVTLNREKVAYIRFPSLPSGLISRPTLVWKIGADLGGERLVEVTYMTSSINWHAEYVGVIDEADESIDLAAWVSIDNRSGATYEDAQLDLVAGDVHRMRERVAVQPGVAIRAIAAEKAPVFEEEALFEYYLYKLDVPATVADREVKQLTFFPSTSVDVEKVFEFDHQRSEEDVRVILELANTDEAGLGRALPAGKVRMYKEDSAGDLQFIGEDRIDHTPKDEDVELALGNAFDVKGDWKALTVRKVTDKIREEDFEITLKNHKGEDIVVRVVDRLHGYWSVVGSSHEYEKTEAFRLEFEIPVEADGETVLTYTIRYER